MHPCRRAFFFLNRHEARPVNYYHSPLSPTTYFPIDAIKRLFEEENDGFRLKDIVLCSCSTCIQDGGSVDERTAFFTSHRERDLRGPYATIYALLIHLHRPGLIRKFRMHELKLQDGRYLSRSDFGVLLDKSVHGRNYVHDSDYLVDKILEKQYSFHVRVMEAHSDIVNIPAQELLPLQEDPAPKGSGTFAEVRCFKFQSEDYRSKDFGKVQRFARKIFKKSMTIKAAREWFTLQRLAQTVCSRHLMTALGACWHGPDVFFILQEEADMSLHDYLYSSNTNEPFDSAHLWSEMSGVAHALGMLHDKGTGTKIAYHRDLKPANILLVKGTLKIADFGLLEFKPIPIPGDTEYTGVQNTYDTGYYAPPYSNVYTQASDVWSLACIMSEVAVFDLQGRAGLKTYKHMRINDCPSGRDPPRFYYGQTVKASVLRKHEELDSLVGSMHLVSPQGTAQTVSHFQETFYSNDFFALLASMFRSHGIGPARAVPEAFQIAASISRQIELAKPQVLASTQSTIESTCASLLPLLEEFQVPLLNMAVEDFVNALDRKEEIMFRTVTTNSLKHYIMDLQASLYAERRQRGFRGLEPFLSAFEGFANLFRGSSREQDLVGFIWGPLRLLLQKLDGHHEAFDDVLAIYSQIGRCIPDFAQFVDIFLREPSMLAAVTATYQDILCIHKHMLAFFRQRRWMDLFATTWTRFKARFLDGIKQIRLLRDHIERGISILEFHDFRSECTAAMEQTQIQLQDEDAGRKHALYKWLKPISMENEQHRFSSIWEELPESGAWLREESEFKEWFESTLPGLSKILWLYGRPGSGKTILASRIIAEAQDLSGKTVLFFFFKNEDVDRNQWAPMARTLLAQLLEQDGPERFIQDYLYIKHCANGQELTDALLEELLTFTISNCSSAYIVLDGLDECLRTEKRSGKKNIVRWFCNLFNAEAARGPNRLRCLFTGQADSLAKDYAGIAKIELGPQCNKRDIEVFGHKRSAELQRKLVLFETKAQEIAEKVARAADGIFLYAYLVWQNLCSQTTLAGLEQELGMLSTNLGELDTIYNRILRTIQNKTIAAQRNDAFRVLGWLAYAKRPLKLHEIQTMQSINVDKKVVEFELRRWRVDMKELCESLVEVREDGTVEFVHQSARWYMLRNENLPVAREEISLATLCLKYLTLPSFHARFLNVRQAAAQGEYGFMDYAILNWIRHVEATLQLTVENEKDEELDGWNEFLTALGAFIKLHRKDTHKSFKLPNSRLALYEKLGHVTDLDGVQQGAAWMTAELAHFRDASSNDSVLDLVDVAMNVRRGIEEVFDSADDSLLEDVQLKYGLHLFKCSRFSCAHFIDGFDTPEERNEHDEHHRRPYRCSDEHCSGFKIGFAKKAQLANHEKVTHKAPIHPDCKFATREEIELSVEENLHQARPMTPATRPPDALDESTEDSDNTFEEAHADIPGPFAQASEDPEQVASVGMVEQGIPLLQTDVPNMSWMSDMSSGAFWGTNIIPDAPEPHTEVPSASKASAEMSLPTQVPHGSSLQPLLASKSSMQAPSKRTVEKRGPFQCEHCELKFNRKSDQRSHLAVHATQSKYTCQKCKAVHARFSDWRRHMRSCGTAKSFVCENCGAAFARKDTLNTHRRRKKGC